MSDLISVIIPVYKVEKYLCRCVDSVLDQTYRNMEMILVDDGSPDGCPAICDEYARQDDRVRVIHQENAGLSGARNAGIDAARGQWLAFVDSDDYLAADFLERLYRGLCEYGQRLSVCRWEYVRGERIPERGTGEIAACIQAGRCWRISTRRTALILWWHGISCTGGSCLQDIRYPLGRIHEDEATTYRIYDKVKTGGLCGRLFVRLFCDAGEYYPRL